MIWSARGLAKKRKPLSNTRAYNFQFDSHSCSVDGVLAHSLEEVVHQGLLDPLVPYLTSVSSNNNAVANASPRLTSASSNITTKIVGNSAAESSSKEEEGDLSRAPSVNSLSTMPSSHRMVPDEIMRRTTSSSSLSRSGTVKKSDSSGGLAHALKRDQEKKV